MSGMYWAEDGKIILVNANDEVTQVYLDSNDKSFLLVHPFIWPFPMGK